MNNRKTFLRDADRLLRIIYKEMALENLSYPCGDILTATAEEFDLSSDDFRRRIKRKYILIYPNNYHEDDLDFLFDNLCGKLGKGYGSTDSVYLIFLAAEYLFYQAKNELQVNFSDLLEWDGFRNKVDTKLYVAAYYVQHMENSINQKCQPVIKHSNKQVYDILKRSGISENHMHMKASGYTDDINWYAFLSKSIFEERACHDFVREEGVFQEYEKRGYWEGQLTNFISKIRFVRLLLVGLLYQENIQKLAYLDSKEWDLFLKIVYQQWLKLMKSDDFLVMLDSVDSSSIIQDIESYVRDCLVDDTLSKSNVEKYWLFEMNFLCKAFEYIFRGGDEVSNNKVKSVRFLLNLYISGSTLLKFQFVQDNIGMGFTKFKEKEDNKSFFIKKDQEKEDVLRSVFHKYYRERYVKNIEMRIAPKETVAEYFTLIDQLNKFNQEEHDKAMKELHLNESELPKINFGLIIHFIKIPHKKEKDFTEELADKRDIINHDANIILELLEEIGERCTDSMNGEEAKKDYAHKIVGIDTANYEKDNRPELFGPTFRKIRCGTQEDYVVGHTYHVGEEFTTLTNGLRAIDEVLLFLGYRGNDRLGHGLALGINPQKYYDKKRNNIFCSIGDFLDDLVWMYSVLLEGEQKPELQLYLREKFECYKFDLFQSKYYPGRIPTFEDYMDSFFLRGDCPAIYEPNFEVDIQQYYRQTIKGEERYKLNYKEAHHHHAYLNAEARRLFYHYSFNENLRKRAEEASQFEVNEVYVNCVIEVQKLLKKKILNMGVFIESNPSSNKKISFVQKYTDIPGLNISGPMLRESDIKLPISINTDDSTIFLTDSVNEYSLVAAALIRDGIEPEEVYQYIQQLAEASNVHSFISRY